MKKKVGGHDWIKYEDGKGIDIFAHYPGDPHNGPKCKRCGKGFCHHCNPECYEERCPALPAKKAGRKGK